MDGTVLVADDDRTIRTVLTQALTRAGCKVHATASLVTLMRWIDEGKGDLVVTDVMMPDGNGIDLIPQIAQRRPGLPVIVISAQNTIVTAIRAAEAEAFDYLPKPFDLPDLMKRAARALDTRRSRSTAPVAAPSTPGPAPDAELPLVGRTVAMQALYRMVARVMNVDLPVLITGESGTGKSLIARAIHDFSDRRSLPFVIAAPADLVGPEAIDRLLARVRGGTLVLDEVGDTDADTQGRLARMMDALPAPPPRLLATSQRDLAAEVEAGRFRQDLFYRLGAVPLVVPPLRERVEDIPLLCEHVLARIAREGGRRRQVSAPAAAFLRAQPWPGNVRQLENTLRRLAVTAAQDEISRPDVEAALARQPGVRDGAEASPQGLTAETERLQAAVARHIQRYFDLHGGALPPPGVYDRILHEIEVPLLEISLAATGGNQARCADLLGINRNTLRKKLTDLNIQVSRRRKMM